MNYMISEGLFNSLLTYIAQQPAVVLFMDLERVMQSQQKAQQMKEKETQQELERVMQSQQKAQQMKEKETQQEEVKK